MFIHNSYLAFLNNGVVQHENNANVWNNVLVHYYFMSVKDKLM